MKTELIVLAILAAIGLWVFRGKLVSSTQSLEADPEKVAEYTKHISRRWRYDSVFMQREIKVYWDTVDQVSDRLGGAGRNRVRAALEGGQDAFFSRIDYRREQYFPDGGVTVNFYGKNADGSGKYSFSTNPDSLHVFNVEGDKIASYKIESISDTSFVFIWQLGLPYGEKDAPRFYPMRCKYVAVK